MNTRFLGAITLAIAVVALGACERQGEPSVGEKIDRALDNAQQKLAAAGDRIAQDTDRAVSSLKDKEPQRVARADAVQGNGATATDASPAGSPAVAKESRVADAAITASIKTDFLKDPDLSILKIDVDTRSGVVTLNGLAENEEARKRAERIASAVKGVTEVRNFLVVKRM